MDFFVFSIVIYKKIKNHKNQIAGLFDLLIIDCMYS